LLLVAGRRGAGGGKLPFNAPLQLRRHRDSSQLGLELAEQSVLEAVLPRARGARLEMFSHARHLGRLQLPVEVIVHASKNLLAGITVEVRHLHDENGCANGAPCARQ